MNATLGRCHICHKRRGINYCSACDHWFCWDCSGNFVARAKAYLVERVFGRKEKCCGPDA